MPLLKKHELRRYFKIGAVASILKVQTSHLRFLEDELGLKIKRNRKGMRQFTIDQAHYLSAIIYLTKSFGFKIPGAKNYLELN